MTDYRVPDRTSDGSPRQAVSRDGPVPGSGGNGAPPGGKVASGRGDPGSGEPNWRELLLALWSRKAWIGTALLVFLAGGWLYAQTVSPTYASSATVWMDRSMSEVEQVPGSNVMTGQGWAGFISSRPILVPVVRERQLYLGADEETRDAGLFDDMTVAEAVTPGRYRVSVRGEDRFALERIEQEVPSPMGVLSRLGLFQSDTLVQEGHLGETIGEPAGFSWNPDAEALRRHGTISFSLSTPGDAATALAERMEAGFEQQSSFLEVRLTASEPEAASGTLNAILEQFTSTSSQMTQERIARVTESLQKEVEAARRAVDKVDERLQNAASAAGVRAGPSAGGSSSGSSSGGGASGGETPLYEQRTQEWALARDVERLRALVDSAEAGDTVSVSSLRGFASREYVPAPLDSAVQQLAALEGRRRELLTRYTPRDPNVAEVERELNTFREQRLPALLRVSLRSMNRRLESLRTEIERKSAALERRARAGAEQRSLWTVYERREKRYTELHARLAEMRLARETGVPRMDVLERGSPPDEPESGGGTRYLALASVGGLLFGVGGALLHHRVNRRLMDPESVDDELGVQVLGTIPRLDSPAPSYDDVDRAAFESFRTLRVHLEAASPLQEGVVTVTSPGLRDGKSTLSANLAVSYASAGYRTLLVDADMYRGLLQEMFSRPASPGLSEWLCGECSVDEACHETFLDGLSLLPHGEHHSSAEEHIKTSAMDRHLSQLRRRYDAVVVDVPPLSAGADAPVVGKYSDKVLLVLRTGHTDLRLARIQLGRVAEFDLPLVGAAVNDVPRSNPYYGYYLAEDYYKVLKKGKEA